MSTVSRKWRVFLLVAIATAFTFTPDPAGAQEPTEAQEQYDALKAKGLSDEAAGKALVEVEGERQEQNQREFLGINWGMGIAVGFDLSGRDRVKSAKIVNNIVRVEEENNVTPRIFLETHNFLNRKVMRGDRGDKPVGAHWGNGPFAALQSSSDEAIEAFSLGYMWGFRESPDTDASLNFGVGILFDPSVQILGDGIDEGEELTTGDELRYKKESRVSLVLMTSFSF
jgi:hypothetical protein